MTDKPYRVRFAPSPTGHLHLGGARVALYDYLIARQTGGQFILRIEDTDKKRYVPEAEAEFIQSLKWLGIQWDEGPDIGGPCGPYRQSDKKEVYLKFANQLVDEGKAFYCFCTPEHLEQVRKEQQEQKQTYHYDGTCRYIPLEEAKRRVAAGEKHVIRFKTPKEGTTTVKDIIRGEITVENKNLDDYILVKSDGWALYHLAAAVDDHLMGITHVLRGSEWLPTFPLHSLIHRAFGWEEPKWVHLSVFLKPSGKGKMSKRETAEAIKDGYSIFIKDLEELGYLPEAIVNWIALMGWSYDDKTEFFTMEELIDKFSLEHLNPAPAAINFQKFDYFNGLHIRHLSDSDLADRVSPFLEKAKIHADKETLIKIAPIIKERLVTLDEITEWVRFFFEDISYKTEELMGKNMSKEQTRLVLENSLQILGGVETFSVEACENPLRNYVETSELSLGQAFGVIRMAITGQKVSPPLFESMEILGKEKTLHRIETAISLIKNLD
jgi:glutamyl-tRNA synthetase